MRTATTGRSGIHANGDVTIDMVLQAYERVLKQWPHPDRRHRIEHCSLVNPELHPAHQGGGVIPTPFWTYVYYHGEKWSQYGDEKMRWMFAHRSFLDAGITVPGASDYGPGPFEPLMALQSMVTRRDYRGREWGPNQKVSLDEALRIATINGAYASYEEKTKGSISTGKLRRLRHPRKGSPRCRSADDQGHQGHANRCGRKNGSLRRVTAAHGGDDDRQVVQRPAVHAAGCRCVRRTQASGGPGRPNRGAWTVRLPGRTREGTRVTG